MVGRAVQLRVSKDAGQARRRACSTSADLDGRPASTGRSAVDGVSFEVRAGEILGVAGVQGNGQTELVEAIMGLRPSAAGTVILDGHDISQRGTPRDRLRAGIGYIPEDRQVDGLVRDFPVAENLVLDVYDQPPFASGIALHQDAIGHRRPAGCAEFDIRTPSIADAGRHRCPAATSRR